ncbi:MAG: helix-turn-helix domain-containing protein [Eubacteriales bacterium]|nr:helix-turn-helix domain-containing protein [Eubacteriales bacterium]
MPDFFDPRAAVHPALSMLSTSLAQTEREYACPEGVGRLLCPVSGGCTLVLDEKRVQLQGARMAFLMGPAAYRLSDPTEDFSLTRVDIAMEAGRMCDFGPGELAAAFPELNRLARQPQQCIVFYDHFAMVMSSLQLIHAYSMLSAPERELQISLTLYFLLAAIATSSWDDDRSGEKYNKHVRAALQYIHENYMCNITTTDIATAAGVHIGHLHRIFPAETGYRIGEYLTHVRIEKAKSLLIRTDIPTTAIAHRVGVSTLQYFSRLFRQQVGMTPQTFRKSYNLTCPYESTRQYATFDGNQPKGGAPA